ncbi:transposable element Tcb2 transposase [Trichonephila clavipes]|nr:transposable element Tcb2 transposase [Trichonephila clavipes]
MWNVTDWQKVVFSDESRFVWGTDDNRILVWRRPGEQYNSHHTVLRHTARTAGVMVWGAIAYDNRSTLIVMRGTLTGQRYVDDILRPHVGPFINGIPGAIFQFNYLLMDPQKCTLDNWTRTKFRNEPIINCYLNFGSWGKICHNDLDTTFHISGLTRHIMPWLKKREAPASLL